MKKWRVLLLDTKKSNPNHYICLAIKEAFDNHPLTESITKADYGTAIQRARDNRCNLFVAFDGEELDRGICSRLAALCGTSLLWVTEDPYEVSVNKENSDLFDLIFTNDSGSVDGYGKKGHHLPLAASPSIHYREIPDCDDENNFRYDLFFAGTAWPNRVEFIKRIESSLGEIKLKLALPYNEHIPVPNIDMAPSSYLWRTPNSEFARLANRSRVVLTLHRSFSSSGNVSTANTPGPRLFEVALAGGFQLVDMSLPEVGQYFDEDAQFAGFRSQEECIEKLKFYLTNATERIAMAKSAQARALREHLYIHRLDNIYAEVSKLEKAEHKLVLNHHRRPRVLFVTHNIIGVQPYGGVEVYQHLIINSLQKDFEFFIYAVDRTGLSHGRKYALFDENMRVIETHAFDNDISDSVLSCPNRERIFSEILTRNEIGLVHFQHFIGHIPSLPYITKALGIPSIASLHDYYAICRNFNLIGYQGRYCNIAELPPVTCDICLNAQDNTATGSQSVRRAFFSRVLDQVDVLHANTDGVASLFCAMFPSLRDDNRIQISGVPMPPDDESSGANIGVRPVNPLNVAIIGNFTQNKGGDVFIHAFNQMRDDSIRFHIFGTIGEPYNTIMKQLGLPNVEVYGGYSAGTLSEKLKDMSLSLHLSVWPETFCITLSEAWKAGLVPVVSDIGALGERVTHGMNGFKVPLGESGAVVDILRELLACPSRIEQVRAQLTPNLYVTNDSHMSWLSRLYKQLIFDFSVVDPSVTRTTFPISRLSLSDCGITLNKNTWLRKSDESDFQAIIQFMPHKHGSPISKLLRYAKSHGARAAVRRVIHEIKSVYKKTRGGIHV